MIEAISNTDMYLEPQVDEHYASLRSTALLVVHSVEDLKFPPEPVEIPEADRDALLARFLDSPEAAATSIREGDEAAEVVSLAIDFACDYVDARPLRWSPVVVELFMAGWFPRKVAPAARLADAVPSALKAWLRFAGRLREIPETSIEISVAAVDEWIAEMREGIEAG